MRYDLTKSAMPVLGGATSPAQLGMHFYALLTAVLIFGALVRLPYLPNRCHGDLRYYVSWAYRSTHFGLGSVYGSSLDLKLNGRTIRLLRGDNPIGHMAVFHVVGSLYPMVVGTPFTLEQASGINHEPDSREKQLGRTLFKLPAVLADLATVALLGWWIARGYGACWGIGLAALYSVHPMTVHNSAIWGQIDAWHSLFMTLAVLCWSVGRYRAGSLLLVIALLFKLQAIALVPLSLTVLLMAPGEPVPNWRRLLRTVGIAAIVVVSLWTPWIVTGAGLHILDPYDRAIGQYCYATLNAFNLWWLVNDWNGPAALDFMTGIDDRLACWRVPHTSITISYRLAGMLLWSGTAAWICQQVVRARFEGAKVIWAAVALYLSMFLLATEMHERYLYAALPLMMIAFRPNWRWGITAVILSTAATLNQVLFHAAPPGSWIARMTEWCRPNLALTGDVIAWSLLVLLAVIVARLSLPLPSLRQFDIPFILQRWKLER